MRRLLTAVLAFLALATIHAAPRPKCYWGIEYETVLYGGPADPVWEWAGDWWAHAGDPDEVIGYRLYGKRADAEKCIRKHAQPNHPTVRFRAFETAIPHG